MNFCKAGSLLWSLHIAKKFIFRRRSSISLRTTVSGFVLAAELMVNESPIPPATRLSIVVGPLPSCTIFSVRPAAWQAETEGGKSADSVVMKLELKPTVPRSGSSG
jgi:hypothetical protein